MFERSLHVLLLVVLLTFVCGVSEAQVSPDQRLYRVPQEEEDAIAGERVLLDHTEEKIRFDPVDVGLARMLDAGLFLVEAGQGAINIHHFDRQWQHLRTFGTYGEGPGEFQTVWDLFVQDGMLFVVDYALERITGFTGLGAPARIQSQETFSFAGVQMDAINSAETVGDEQVLFSGRGDAFLRNIIQGRNESCAVFLARKAEEFEQERCVVEYPSHIMEAEVGSVVARDNRVMMRRGATGGIYVWFSHAPTIVRVDPRDLSTTVIDIANPFYAAPEHVHYTELSSREEWLRWRAQHYTVSHVAETEDHLVVQYRGYDLESQEWYVRVVIIDRETRAGVATLRLNSPLLRLFGAVGEHELLLVQFEEDATVLSTVNIPRLVADLAD